MSANAQPISPSPHGGGFSRFRRERMRFHKKADGILMICDDGRGRFLTMWERILFAFGIRPAA